MCHCYDVGTTAWHFPSGDSHSHTQVTPRSPYLGKLCSRREKREGGLQTSFLWGGPLSPSMSYQVHSLISPHESFAFHLMNFTS